MTKHIKGIFMAILATSMWGILGPIRQMILQQEQIPAAWLTTAQLSIAGLLIVAWCSRSKSRAKQFWAIWRDRRDRLGLIWLGILGYLATQFTYFTSTDLGNAVTASLLHFLGPVFVLFYFMLYERRWPTKYELAICAFALIGTFLLLTNGTLDQLTVPPLAVFFGIVSAMASAFYLIQPVRLIKKWGIWLITGWGMLIGGGVMNFFAPIWQVPAMSIRAWIFLICLILFGAIFGFILYLGSLQYIRSVEAGILSCIEPLVAAITAYFWLQQELGGYEIIGGVLILWTISLVSWHNAQQQTHQRQIHKNDHNKKVRAMRS